MRGLIISLLLISIFHYSFSQKAKLILPVGLTGNADHLEISSNQKYLFTTCGSLLQVWDYQSGKELDSVRLPLWNVAGPLAFFNDKYLVAYCERERDEYGKLIYSKIHLYNFLSKKVIRTFSLGKTECQALTFSNNGMFINTVTADDGYGYNTIFLRYNIIDGSTDTLNTEMKGLTSISFSRDSKLALLWSENGGPAYLYNLTTHKKDVIEVQGTSRFLLLNDSSVIAIREDKIEIWELKDNLFQRTFVFKPSGKILNVDISKDGKLIYTAANKIEELRTATGMYIGYKLIDTKLVLIDLLLKKTIDSFILPVGQKPQLVRYTRNTEAVIVFDDHSLFTYQLSTGKKINDFNGKSSDLLYASLSQQNKFLQVWKDKKISQLNTTSASKTKEFSYKHYKILGISDDGRFEILREIKVDCDSSFRDTIPGVNWILNVKTNEYNKLNVYKACDTSVLKIFDTYTLTFAGSIIIPKDLSAATFITPNEVALGNIVWNIQKHSYSKQNINSYKKAQVTIVINKDLTRTKFSYWNENVNKNIEVESGININKLVYDKIRRQIICIGYTFLPDYEDDSTVKPNNSIDSLFHNLQNELTPHDSTKYFDYYSYEIKIYDIPTGKFIFEKTDSNFNYTNFAFSEDKRFFAFVKSDGSYERESRLEVYDIENNKQYEMKNPYGNLPDKTGSLSFSNDNKFLICTRTDKQISFYDFRKQELSFSLFLLDSSDWIVQNKDGLFDATRDAMQSMYFAVTDTTNKETPWQIIDFNQLKHRYYQPELLPILLGFKNEKLREVPAFNKIALAPKVGLSLQQDKFSIQLINQKGGIGKTSVYIDNAEIIEDVRQNPSDSTRQTLQITVDLNRYGKFINPKSVNIIKVIAFNGEGWLSSKPDTIHYTPSSIISKGVVESGTDEKKSSTDIRFYGLVAGTSDYSGNNIDLKYAAKDAQDFANALAISSANLFGKSNTTINLLNSEAKTDSLEPTKKNIQRFLQWVSTVARPQDVLVIYLSGHGVNYGGQDGDFFYLTSTASGADAEYFKDPEVRNSVAISSSELTMMLNKIAARKKVLLLDACASGKAAENMMTVMKDVPASQTRALDRMADRTGFYILSGSAANAVSYESTMYGQGLLTYSLLKAMRGAALRQDGNEEYVDIQKLLQYAVDEVPLLAKGIGGIQQPLYRSPGDQKSYDIGKIDAKTKKEIVLAELKPVFVATTFININENEDDMKITQLVNAQLREITSKGKDADFLFTEAKDYPDAWNISGNYKIVGNIITLSYRLRKNDEKIDRIVKGNKTDLKSFINLMLKEVRSAIAK